MATNKLERKGDGWLLKNSRLAAAQQSLDLSTRGTPAERAELSRQELAFWAPYRRRANALLDGPLPQKDEPQKKDKAGRED